jgi:hypothetical protein
MTDDPKRAQARRSKHTTNFSSGLARQMAPAARRDQRYESLLTTATLAIGLALPAVAQVDPGRSSPLGGKHTSLFRVIGASRWS